MSKKSIKQTSKRLRQKRKSDFKATNDINDAVFENLLKSVKGSKKSLTKSQVRNLVKLDKLEQNLRAAGRRTEKSIDRNEAQMGSFGGMLSGVYSKQRADAGAATKSGTKMAVAGEKQASDIAQVGQDVIDIAKQGAKEAQAGADYLASQGNSLRRSEDIKFVAQMRHDEEMAKLQSQLAEQAAKKQFDREKKMAEFEFNLLQTGENAAAVPQVRAVGELMTDVATELWDIRINGDLRTLDDLPAIMEELGKRLNIVTESDAQAVQMFVKNLLRMEDPTSSDIANEALSVIGRVPGWENLTTGKARDRLMKALSHLAEASVAGRQTAAEDWVDDNF